MGTKTQNYQLNQWAPEDSFLRTDFNEDNAKIDAAIKEAAERKPYITGNYVGNGNYGSGSLTQIDFGFTPSLVVIVGGYENNTSTNALLFHPSTIGGGGTAVLRVTWTSTGVKWYAQDSAAAQMNHAGKRYYYIAFR